MTRYTFEEVRYPASKTVKCSGCGKSVKRSTTFTATVNPWNLNEDGDPATPKSGRSYARRRLPGSLSRRNARRVFGYESGHE